MNPLNYLPEAPPGHILTIAAATLAVACVVILPYAIKRMGKYAHGKVSLAVALGFVAAAGCTLYSARASWVFAERKLHITDTVERATLFAVGEVVLLALIFMARQNLNSEEATPGVYGLLAKVVVGVQILPAYEVADDLVSGTVMAFFGPIMAMIMWHLMLGIELKHKKPDAQSMSMWAQIGRELRQRIFAYMGLARRNRSALEIIQDRFLLKAVDHERTLELLTGNGRWTRSVRIRTERKLDIAISRGIGGDPARRRRYLELLNERRGTANLRALAMHDTWAATADLMGREAYPEAHALSRQTATLFREATDRALPANRRQDIQNGIFPSDTSPAKAKLLERMRARGITPPPEGAVPFADIDPSLMNGAAADPGQSAVVPRPARPVDVTPKQQPGAKSHDDDPDDDPDPQPPARGPVPDPQPETAREHPAPPADTQAKPSSERTREPNPEKQPDPVGAGHDQKTGDTEDEKPKDEETEDEKPKDRDPKRDAEVVKQKARDAYIASARVGGKPIKALPLAEKFGMKERWGYARINEAKDQMAKQAATGSHLRAVSNN